MKEIYTFNKKLLFFVTIILLFCTALQAQSNQHYYFNATITEPPCDFNSFTSDPNKFVEITVKGKYNNNGIFVGSSSDTTKTLRFLTYNLGAKADMTPKQQMAHFPVCPEDITVYGRWYQWGRKDSVHTFRCYQNPSEAPSRFAYRDPISDLANDHGKFIYGFDAIPHNWFTPHTDKSPFWGNGGGANEQANTTYINGQNSENPCPKGWRVPTQHEWALLWVENGDPTAIVEYSPSSTVNNTSSGLYWVEVVNGYASSAFTDVNHEMCGFALYTQLALDTVDPGYKLGTLDLTDANAPDPLMFLSCAGYRDLITGEQNHVGTAGVYWSSTINTHSSYVMYFASNHLRNNTSYARTFGYSVRCMQEVCPKVKITGQIPSTGTTCSNPAELTVTPNGNKKNFTYEWYKGAVGSGTPVGTDTSAYTATTAATYYCIVKNNCGNSDTAVFTVNNTLKQNNPSNAIICSGTTNIMYLAAATGATITGYQWETSTDSVTWTNVTGGSGATSVNYTTPVLTHGSETYFRRVAMAACGKIISAGAKVTVGPCVQNSFPTPANYVDIPISNPSFPSVTNLRFLTYNLGANPNMTPKQQMAYPGCSTDMTVFGGWYQWGRSHIDHTFRCDADPDVTFDLRFSTTILGSVANDVTGEFIYTPSITTFDWLSPQVTTLWGDGTLNGTNSGSNNPCPPGYRVPTEHEWALLGWEGGSPTTTTNDRNNSISTTGVTLAPNDIYWVQVNHGRVNHNFVEDNMCGFALYEKSVWDAKPIANGGSLIDASAPEPLMFLPAAGIRHLTNGIRKSVGKDGYYWSSSPVGAIYAYMCYFDSVSVYANSNDARAYGCSVRCIAQ